MGLPGTPEVDVSGGGEILVVDDDDLLRELIAAELAKGGHHITSAEDGQDALTLLEQHEVDVVVTDLVMPRIDGVALLSTIKERWPETEVVVVTAQTELDDAVRCLRLGAFDFVTKAQRMTDLAPTVARAVERRRLRRQTALYKASQLIFSVKERASLFQRIVDVVTEIMQADDCSIMLPAADGRLHVAYSNGLSEEKRRRIFAGSERIASRISQDRRPVILHGDARGDGRFQDLAPFREVRSSIVYPLCTAERLLGVLNVNRVAAERKPFKPDDLERLTVLAAQIVLALEVHELLRQLTASERFASIGQLASGIAHEINNPVSYVMSNVQYCQEVLASLEAGGAQWSAELATNLRTALTDAEEGTVRIRDVIHDMRNMTRNAKQDSAILDINDAVNAALRMVSADLRACAELSLELRADLGVLGTTSRIAQVLVNLFSNAVHAIQQTPSRRGKLVVRSYRRGERVLVEVEDTGIGIEPDHMSRLFDPFFTTKPPEQGSGLGLAICREIVQMHGGEITVRSTVGQGATFTLDLPWANPYMHTVEESESNAVAGTPLKGRALLIDNEVSLLRSYTRALEGEHEVKIAESAPAALSLLERDQAFDVVVCDLLMPEVSGMELFDQVSMRFPSLMSRFVFLTGSIGHPAVQRFIGKVENLVLEKPLSVAGMRQLIELGRSGGPLDRQTAGQFGGRPREPAR